MLGIVEGDPGHHGTHGLLSGAVARTSYVITPRPKRPCLRHVDECVVRITGLKSELIAAARRQRLQAGLPLARIKPRWRITS